ncbi:secreted protein [Streptantibioticus cattleyicolor NRRL 8057 = DSM 46488]|uniref:Secreted protein n=1 Tax=Streptantibioticus cattleyicolor (strain ATCC 35852 / DSM 46488 / JCM 4925 / NBRC 14057 / NRRL 8057) TaxID=1003195 RepID=F8JSP5_STREN|nr:secreted protein [Streptantibioticus cattleyicolor NRRL 8057 = DSM 46488]MYS62355.1 glycoside hydrolase family 92 protein [Streptomyces sp. SID5468]CCB78269.1 putative secreted protein [Streptantibioticus cattleyicolor NRRL 8057 = DSM 46488]
MAATTVVLLVGSAGPLPAADAAGSVTDLVNPFVGTASDSNTFPGAAVPFGMAQVSPDTGYFAGYVYGGPRSRASGHYRAYDYAQKRIRGFSMVHLSGVGCGAGGDLPTLPTTGPVTSTDYADYAASFSHASERATPGYYRVRLTSYGGITAELTATARTGRQRYSFPATRTANVLVNTGQALHKVTSSSVTVLDDRTVATTVTGRGFCADTRPYTLYAITRFSRPFTAHGTWNGRTVTAGSRHTAGGGRRGAYLRFDTRSDRTVTATTALSYVSAAGARRNLDREGGGGFDTVRENARREWERRLGRLRVRGGTESRRRMLYSALYHALLSPNAADDVNGDYRGWDGRVHRARGFRYYQNWSLWDTYRTQARLLELFAPGEARDMALSLLKVSQQGWLPKWGLATVETNVMTGDPVTPYLTDAYAQGLLKGHEEEAYTALKRNADSVPSASSPYEGRGGNPRYLKDGYVPLEPHAAHKPGDYDPVQGGSATLEYALADAALAAMAHDLGHDADAERFLARGHNYRNLFDRRTGWFRARDARGAFTGPADPKDSVGFHEGTAAQYMWLVPQDLPGLVDLIGGRKRANARLDAFFGYDRLLKDPSGTARTVWVHGPFDYYHQNTYNPQNEPDLLAPYTYLATGEPWKSADVVRAALALYGDKPNGIPGNDDMGTMSAWAVLSAIGVFPVQPGTPVWGLSTPAFERIDLALDPAYYPGGQLTVTAPGVSDTNRYVRSVRVGDRSWPATWLTTDDLRRSGTVAFTVGGSHSRWGTGDDDGLPAIGPRRDR